MDAHLKSLADASLAVEAAEQALAEQAHHAAADQLDTADALLTDLRAAWPGMSASERTVVARPAGDIRSRLDAARARVPRLSALSVGTPVIDPEEESDPAD